MIAALAPAATEALSHIILVYGAFDKIAARAKHNPYAKEVLVSWANGDWFLMRPDLPEKLTVQSLQSGRRDQHRRFLAGETRLEPPRHSAARALRWERLAFRAGLRPSGDSGKKAIAWCLPAMSWAPAHPRKSAINSLMWHIGEDIPCIPNKQARGAWFLAVSLRPSFSARRKIRGDCRWWSTSATMKTGDILTLDTVIGDITNESGRKDDRPRRGQTSHPAGRSSAPAVV